MDPRTEAPKLVDLTADIVSAFVSHNSVPATELPDLIAKVYQSLGKVTSPEVVAPIEEKREPAVPIKKSITPNYLICLNDGRSFRSLKRHLRSSYNLSPEDYRKMWDLPPDYPMVAPAYAEARSQLAKKMGLGQAEALTGCLTAAGVRTCHQENSRPV
ncbi:MucR family transcriptional regulator [Bosea sp. BIWAKO-01]|uniref:MucR family transcriptional regulator n=1 Tax=Bosea sp. BIWAKO-01 TaxID=506668 RepID=UPI0009FEF323|nr:MucR family transcriptional regulator [Bosea sp. BIWAKO-01]